MSAAQFIVLLLISALVPIVVIALIALNVVRYIGYASAAADDLQLRSASKTAWILSIAAGVTGPCGPILSFIALVMASVQLHASRKNNEPKSYRIIPTLAIYNAVTILLACCAYFAWTLWLSATTEA